MKIPKALDKILTIIGYALSIAPYILIGIHSASSADALIENDHGGLELLLLGGFLLVAVLFLLMHIIIHEGGHLVMGLATGWKYSSFRIGTLVLAKQDGKLKWKKTTVMGTGGQCLMIPPECEPEKCPFFLYLLGGGLANIVTGGIALAIGLLLGGIAEVILVLFAITGFGLGVMNLFPAKMGGTMNDGYQIFIEFPGNSDTKKYTYCLLAANAILSEAESTKALPEALRSIILNSDYSDLSNTSIANLYLFKGVILQEEEKYEELRELYRNVAESGDAVQLFRNEANCELLYLEIMGDCNSEEIERIADKKLMEYIKATALYPSRKRLMYAYYLIYKKDTEAAEKELEALKNTASTHPSRTEGVLELKEAERIRLHYENGRTEQKA